jgi:cytochrome c-type biogenesis protein CcmH/NrfF
MKCSLEPLKVVSGRLWQAFSRPRFSSEMSSRAKPQAQPRDLLAQTFSGNPVAQKTRPALLFSPVAAVVLAVLLLGAHRDSFAQTLSNDAAFRSVSNRLQCQCGCGYNVQSCNMVDCPSAGYLRKSVQASLASGKNADAVVASFVDQYGPRILNEPPKSGFWLTAWLMPFVALTLGAMLVSYVLWQWKLRARLAGGPGAVPSERLAANMPEPALVAKYRAQIDRDLERED